MWPISVSVEGVISLNNIKFHKATGPDKIPAYFLKETAAEVAHFNFQSSLKQGVVPYSDWKVTNIVPLHKKGWHAQTSNYRPVSLTSICKKILEHAIYSCIHLHLNSNNILCNKQHGFWAKRSCETQLILTINDFVNCLNNNQQLRRCYFLDFSKTFDRVPYKRLLKKLFLWN